MSLPCVMVERSLREDEAWNRLSPRLASVIARCIPWADPQTGVVASSMEGFQDRVAPRVAQRHLLRWIELLVEAGFLYVEPGGAIGLTQRVMRPAAGAAAERAEHANGNGTGNGAGPRTVAERKADQRDRDRIEAVVAEHVAPLQALMQQLRSAALRSENVTSPEPDVTNREAVAVTSTSVDVTTHARETAESESESKRESETAAANRRCVESVPEPVAAAADSSGVVDVTGIRERLLAAGMNPAQADAAIKFNPLECIRQLDFTENLPPGWYRKSRAAYLVKAIVGRYTEPTEAKEGRPPSPPPPRETEEERIVREIVEARDRSSPAAGTAHARNGGGP